MKSKFFTLSAVLVAGVTLASCSPAPSQSNSNTSSSNPGSNVPTDGQWAAEDAAHVSETITGKANFLDGINLSGISAAEKASILGDVESWARKNHLLGIPLYGDGGWSLYNSRIQSPIAKAYVPNYGYGILREGKVTRPMSTDQEPNATYAEYLHSGLGEATGEMNPFHSNNSTASGLLSYIQGSLYARRLVKDGNGGYNKESEWYDSLADGEPVPMDATEGSNLARKWRVTVRTGTDAIPVKYKTLSTKSIGGTQISSFNDREVTAQDYVDAYRLLLNGKNGYAYASQYTDFFAGALEYNQASANIKVFTPEDDALWEKVGIKVIDNKTIEIEMSKTYTPTQFKYYGAGMTPVNRDFYKLVTEWNDDAKFNPLVYGTKSADGNLTPADTILSIGPYTLSKYESGTGSDNEIVFVRNDDWIDRKRENNDKYEVYSIKGVKVSVNSRYNGDNGLTAQYNDFIAGKLDSSGIPDDKKGDWEGDKPEKYVSGTTDITSLQVNSTTPERWEELFGANAENWKNPNNNATYDDAAAKAYVKKPIMSNSDFLDGLYFSINRQELADSLMRSVSGDWMGEEYLVDLDSNVSYNSTAAHKRAVQDWAPETYGFSSAIAQRKFSTAIDQLVANGSYTAGTVDNPTVITINLQIGGEVQRKNWAEKVAGYIETEFNAVGKNKGVTLDVAIPAAPPRVLDIYTMIQRGVYDLAWGGVGGNTGDAFAKTGLLLDDYNNGFFLSAGVDPKTVDNTIHHGGVAYSAQAIYYAVNSGRSVVIQDGVFTKYVA